MQAYHEWVKLFKALAHPARLRILYALQERGQYVCHLVALLGRRQPAVSQHLAVLRAAGLVAAEREGNRILYRLTNGRLLRLLELLAEGREEATRASRREVWRICSCPRCTRRREQQETAHRQWSETRVRNDSETKKGALAGQENHRRRRGA